MLLLNVERMEETVILQSLSTQLRFDEAAPVPYIEKLLNQRGWNNGSILDLLDKLIWRPDFTLQNSAQNAKELIDLGEYNLLTW